MSEPQFTKGTWRVVQRRASGAFMPRNGLTLRALWVDTLRRAWSPKSCDSGGYTELDLQDARLIAAAPDMFEALEALSGHSYFYGHEDHIWWCNVCNEQNDIGSEIPHDPKCPVGIAMAALAKAVGK